MGICFSKCRIEDEYTAKSTKRSLTRIWKNKQRRNSSKSSKRTNTVEDIKPCLDISPPFATSLPRGCQTKMVPKSYNIFSATTAVTSDSLVHDVTMINPGQIDKSSHELESTSDFFPDPESDLTIVSVLSDFESECSSIDFSDVESDCGSDSSWRSHFESIAISDLDCTDECETNSEFEDEDETDLDLTIVTQMEFEDSFSVMGSRQSSFREDFDNLSEVDIEDEIGSRIGDDHGRQYVVDEMDQPNGKFIQEQKSARQRYRMVAQAVVGFFRTAWIKSRRAFKLKL